MEWLFGSLMNAQYMGKHTNLGRWKPDWNKRSDWSPREMSQYPLPMRRKPFTTRKVLLALDKRASELKDLSAAEFWISFYR
jgi:hypothetical protein